MLGLKSSVYLSLFLFVNVSGSSIAADLSSSTAVQANIKILIETKSCPKCDLSGAVLNRLDLSDANLEGANLSRAKMSLTNLSGANLKNADLREAIFNGADLSDIDLRGADLTGTSMVGAYMRGAQMDGEMLVTTPYSDEGISDVKETVYVEDTVKAKVPQKSEEMTIASRRDFEETPPPVPVETTIIPPVEPVEEVVVENNVTLAYTDESLPKQSDPAPDSKAAPAIQEVHIEEEVVEEQIIEETPPPAEIVDEKNEIMSNGEEVLISEVLVKEEIVSDEVVSDEVLSEESDMLSSVVENTTIDEVVAEEAVTVAETQDKKPEIVEPEPEEKIEETPVASEEQLPKEEDIGIMDRMMSVFSSEEPTTEVLKNVALLLDTNSCYGCNLAGADLSGKNLDTADLEGADLSNANLQGADLEGANLKGSNLSGANLSKVDLSEADLYMANLSNADLTDANLEDTLFDDTNLTNVKGYIRQTGMMLMEKQ